MDQQRFKEQTAHYRIEAQKEDVNNSQISLNAAAGGIHILVPAPKVI